MMIEPSLASKLEAPCLLSVVVPVFNEEAVLPAFHQRLGAVLGDLGDDCEVLYVDDGSTDRSATILAQLQAADRRVGVARFTRNFGKEQAMSAGLKLSRGAAVIVIDADLQDPPELIPQCSAVAVLARIWKINDAVEMAPEDAQPIEYQRKLTRRGLGFTQARSSQTGGIASASQHPKYLQALAGRTSEYPTRRRLAQVARLSCAPNRHGTPGSSLRTYHPVLAEGH
nr:glycosyltransferase family 2 protein [Pseudomonas aeruginosa]